MSFFLTNTSTSCVARASLRHPPKPCVPMRTGLTPAPCNASSTPSGVTSAVMGRYILRQICVSLLLVDNASRWHRTDSFVSVSAGRIIAELRANLFQCLGASEHFRDLLGNLGLPRPVVQTRDRLDQFRGLVRRRLHRRPPGNLLADRRVEETLEQPDLER